ncbi:MAG: GAF domain-containing protein [Xenococcaceae cyanobacterium MO_188.B32]|nr:GAF domain-containing protein [Xenococcaceae cyanobacterium MO_188.B32]
MKHLPSSDFKLDKNSLPTKINNNETINNNNNINNSNGNTTIIRKNLKNKIITRILLLSIIPVVFLGATSYIKNQSIEAKISPTEEEQIAYVILYQQSIWLVLATGTIAGVTGTIAFMLADRFIDPILKSASTTAKIVDRLYAQKNIPDDLTEEDELSNLVANLNLIEQKLPDLLWKQEAKKENFQTIMEVVYSLQRSRSVEELFRNTVAETRRVLRADRVTILRIESGNRGTFVEESVASRLPKILWTTIEDLNFELEYLENYQKDYIRAIDNVYQANLSERYLKFLERFAVKANIIAPIKCNKSERLLGLLIAHQCNSFRNWQPQEIELITHIAQQVGFSLEHTQILENSDAKAEQAQKFIELSHQIRESLNETEVLNITVKKLRQEIRADRVLVYSFNSNWSGYISAESILPGWLRALSKEIKDPCIPQHLIQAYMEGRIVTIDNVFEADFHPEHLQLLKQLEIKASLITPIVNNGKLFGLLIAHQCSAPRQWLRSEINLFSQISTQVGFALEHARLLAKVKAEGDKNKLLENITHRVSTSLNSEEILADGVEEIREFLNCDRVIVYNFDKKWNGTVTAESVVSDFPPMLQAQIYDPCFAEGFIEKYQAGRVQVLDNIYEAELTDCHLQQLEKFEVKANLVAPILEDNKLLGLLIAHQCSASRYWQDWEVKLFTQVAQQISFALGRVRLVEKLEAESRQNKLIADISRKIRSSLVEENVLNTAVTEVRKVLECDRVMVYNFDPQWNGTVVAESVVPGFSKALWREIKDPCFMEGYVEKYQAGRMQVVDDIYKAGLTSCHIEQLEHFQIKANLVAPILKDEKLMGLLIANHCSAPYSWQEWEVNLFSSIASQVSFALEHCRIVNHSEQSYYQVKTTAIQQQKTKDLILTQILDLLNHSEQIVANLSEQNLSDRESLTAMYRQIQTITDAVVELNSIARQAEQKENEWLKSFADSQESWSQAIDSEQNLRLSTIEISTKTKHLIHSSQELLQILNTISERIAQLKLEGMNGVLEAARKRETSQKFAAVSQKIHSLAQEIDQELALIQPLASAIQTDVQEIDSILELEENQINKVAQLQEQTQQKFQQVNAAKQQITAIVNDLGKAATEQVKALREVGESLSLMSDPSTRKNLAQSQTIMASLTKLKTEAEELKTSK